MVINKKRRGGPEKKLETRWTRVLKKSYFLGVLDNLHTKTTISDSKSRNSMAVSIKTSFNPPM